MAGLFLFADIAEPWEAQSMSGRFLRVLCILREILPHHQRKPHEPDIA